ncbi:Glycoside hydrolase family 31 [Dillenia turbinata]|uniref:Glycoside hydrolase family 31 n=1 Tax=Dillenia turbinata TaxID=194707 RepID=A0AAN8ZEJ5_9MAGN
MVSILELIFDILSQSRIAVPFAASWKSPACIDDLSSFADLTCWYVLSSRSQLDRHAQQNIQIRAFHFRTERNKKNWCQLHNGLSGQPLSGPDIGGFGGNATPRLFGRWMGVGAMLPFCRGHSENDTNDHEPWSFGEEVGFCSASRILALSLNMFSFRVASEDCVTYHHFDIMQSTHALMMPLRYKIVNNKMTIQLNALITLRSYIPPVVLHRSNILVCMNNQNLILVCLVPLACNGKCEEVCRLALKRRYHLIPHIYTLFYMAHTTGTPVAVPIFFADPKDPSLRRHENSFLLGPVLNLRAIKELLGSCGLHANAFPSYPDQGSEDMLAVLPSGIWLNFDFDDSHPDLPSLYLKGGSVIPLGPPHQHVGEAKLNDDLTLLVALDENVKRKTAAKSFLKGIQECQYHNPQQNVETKFRINHRITILRGFLKIYEVLGLDSRKAEGLLFEDDGDGYDFTKGGYLLTYYAAECVSSTITVSISKTEGLWQRPKRRLHVVILLGEGATLDAWGTDGEVLQVIMPSEKEVSGLVSASKEHYKARIEINLAEELFSSLSLLCKKLINLQVSSFLSVNNNCISVIMSSQTMLPNAASAKRIPDVENGAEISKSPNELKRGAWILKVVPWVGGRIIAMMLVSSGAQWLHSGIEINGYEEYSGTEYRSAGCTEEYSVIKLWVGDEMVLPPFDVNQDIESEHEQEVNLQKEEQKRKDHASIGWSLAQTAAKRDASIGWSRVQTAAKRDLTMLQGRLFKILSFQCLQTLAKREEQGSRSKFYGKHSKELYSTKSSHLLENQ